MINPDSLNNLSCENPMLRHTLGSLALAHHWLVSYRGGERVLAEFRKLFGNVPVYTLVYRNSAIPGWVAGSEIYDSWLGRLPYVKRYYRALLPLYPHAVSGIRVSQHMKFLLSSDASVIKGIKLPQGAVHVCYCHSPPRYLWDMTNDYVRNSSGLGVLGRTVFKKFVPYVRSFDYRAAQNVTAFIANSQFVAGRIEQFYKRDAHVIYPPINCAEFNPEHPQEDFYLIVSQLVPYKRVDLAVQACSRTKRKLIVIGEGPELPALRRIAGYSVTFLGWQPFSVVKYHMERCRAFLYPQMEDFGISAVEAQAAGRPVIAYGQGGALETVIDEKTGVIFEQQSAEALEAALTRFEQIDANQWRWVAHTNAQKFDVSRFKQEISSYLMTRWPGSFSYASSNAASEM